MEATPVRRASAAYPQDDTSPLCCCEFFNRRGERTHVLQMCCACEEFDEACDLWVRGSRVGRDRLDEIFAEFDDRMRLPLPGGAWHVGLPAVVPWLVLPLHVLLGSLGVRCFCLSAVVMLPSLLWWHMRTLRLRRRTRLLPSWLLASLAFTHLVYWCKGVPHAQPAAATAVLAALDAAALGCLWLVHATDPSSTRRVADAASAEARAARCAICGVQVPRYDHYCTWTDAPIGAANHRAYLGFVASLLAVCAVGGAQLASAAVAARPLPGVGVIMQLRAGRVGLLVACARPRRLASLPIPRTHPCLCTPRVCTPSVSELRLSRCAAYAFAVALALAALLAHQVSLLARGLTTYEARKGRAATPGGGAGRLATFLRQTAPLLAGARERMKRAD